MLNFHHLQYFWAVAKDGHLTRTAERLRVSPSALSSQISQLEEQLGEPLFTREGRRLVLTEAGRLALSYAEQIFTTGQELEATFKDGRRQAHLMRIGAVSTLSRNFLHSFVGPLLTHEGVRLRIATGKLDALLESLAAHELDLVLSNRPPSAPTSPAAGVKDAPFRCRRLARQAVSIISTVAHERFRFPQDLAGPPLILPGPDTEFRMEFDALCERSGLKVNVLAEVDDMATIRLLVRGSTALALVPSVVVRDELRFGTLFELCVVPEIAEAFYAVTVERQFQHPLVRTLLARREKDLLTQPAPSRG
jgi:LysR family transcriptional regulator, transcriptional activator of nhaA